MSFFYGILKRSEWEVKMNIFNSKTNKIEVFKPINENKVMMYVCGPTVYNHAHIGNARPIVVFDLLKRVLETEGYEVHYVSNFTDIDDKIVTKAIDENKTEVDVSEEYIEAYNKIRAELFSNHLDATPRVTETMDEIIGFIQKLLDEDAAYAVDGNVYFRVDKINNYGSISNQDIEALQIGSRIERNVEKENPLDFVLWKKTTEGITWETPWGVGRPGWHTECVVMIHKEFNTNTIDIHGGGQDLKFPHHENESAQNKALHHDDLANYWVHNAMLNIDDEKMSKSLGNVFWAKDFIAEFGSNVSRWILLSTHYRLVLNITDQLIEQAQAEISRIEHSLNQAEVYLQINKFKSGGSYNKELYKEFLDCLYDDLNLANAEKVLFDLIKKLNQAVRSKNDPVISELTVTLKKMLKVLGLNISAVVLNREDYQNLEQWEQYKLEKNYEQADAIRGKLIERGIL